jgi:hypothetical protein
MMENDMEDQMRQQFEQFQRGLTSVFGIGPKMADPALRSNEVLADSLGKLARDQIELGCSWLDIGRRQMASLAQSKDVTALFRDQDTPSEYYTAATQYGEAVRQNMENTRERLTAIGREATDTATGTSA